MVYTEYIASQIVRFRLWEDVLNGRGVQHHASTELSALARANHQIYVEVKDSLDMIRESHRAPGVKFTFAATNSIKLQLLLHPLLQRTSCAFTDIVVLYKHDEFDIRTDHVDAKGFVELLKILPNLERLFVRIHKVSRDGENSAEPVIKRAIGETVEGGFLAKLWMAVVQQDVYPYSSVGRRDWSTNGHVLLWQ